MLIAVIILSILTLFTLCYSIALSFQLQSLTKVVNLLDKEQHTQNTDIINLIKYANESSEVIASHAKVLDYLVKDSPGVEIFTQYFSHIKGEA
jgi:hypothetical protein